MAATQASSRLALCVALVTGVSAAHGQAPSRPEPSARQASVKAAVCTDSIRRTVQIELATPSTEYIRLRRDYLPWARHGSIIVRALRLDRREWLQEDIPVSDPTGGSVDVPAGTRLAGDIDLDERFPTLASALKDTDVVVFWAFRLEASDWTATAAAGAVVLEQGENRVSEDETGRICTEHRISLIRKGSGRPD